MAELLRERAENPESQDMILLYADMPEAEIAAAEQAIRDAVNPRTLRRYPIGVSVATNTGPQSLAVIYDGRIA
jgi:fatty acid-binding protein DegV